MPAPILNCHTKMTSITTLILASVSTTHTELFGCPGLRNPLRLVGLMPSLPWQTTELISPLPVTSSVSQY